MRNPISAFCLRLLLVLFTAVGFTSCMVYEGGGYYADGPYYEGGGYYADAPYYGGGGYAYDDDWGDDYYYGYYPPAYRSYVTYSAAWPYYYGGRYYSYRWWDDDQYRHYCYDHGSNGSHYRKRRSSEEMKLVRYHGPERGRLPTGYHSEQWYRDRGYSVKTNTYRERDGDLRGRQPSSSSTSRNKADSRPTSEHPRAIRQPDKYRYTGSSDRGSSDRSSSNRVSSNSGNNDRRSSDARRSSSSSRSEEGRRSSGSSGSRSRSDSRPTSEHPRALQQPDKYRYTGTAGGGSRNERSGASRGENRDGGGRGSERSGGGRSSGSGGGGDKGGKNGKKD
ncbi:MAG: hypothetical protein ACKV19_26140 [Verrucomicrobiales bacterium]